MVLNISSDIMIILIPMPVFLQSKIAPKKKLILCGVFAVGCFTVRFRPFSSRPLSRGRGQEPGGLFVLG